MAYLRKTIVSAVALSFLAHPALAHNGADIDADNAWQAWRLTPDIVLATLLVLAVHWTGMWRRRAALDRWQLARGAAFFAGVATVFLALQSPVDPIAERLFSMHQIQHMLLRVLGPLLIAWSLPAAMLIAGLPRWARGNVLSPMMSNSSFRGFFGVLGGPVVATVLFIASLYVWEVPAFHDAALLNEGLHYTMHVTMLAAGLLFWARIFDSRTPPKGIRFGVRLMMLWIAILANIVIGAATALKPMVLYHAYDIEGRLFDMPAMSDEQLGGMLIWIPSSMMCLVAIIIVIHTLARYEEYMERVRNRWTPSNSAALAWPVTGAELVARTRVKNRQMALGFAGFSISIFMTAIMLSILSLHAGQTQRHRTTAIRQSVARRRMPGAPAAIALPR